MSKEAAVRAMREARYAAAAKGAPVAAPARRPEPAVRPPVAPTVDTTPEPAAAPAGEALCGHRSMNGRTCTREHGHASKSHRYS